MKILLQARPPTMTAPHTLVRKSSSIKGKLVEIRTQFGELTNLVKAKKNGKSLTGGSGQGSKANTLDRHSSWKAAAKAVKGSFTRRSNGERSPLPGIMHVLTLLRSHVHGCVQLHNALL